MVVVDAKGAARVQAVDRGVARRFCVFEHVYFARPDSQLDGALGLRVRKALGRALAKEHPVEADVVIPVPDSGAPAAIGFARESGIPFELGLIRSHYVGRTFIEPQQSIRHFGVQLKLNAGARGAATASASSSSTTRSCAARPRARSSRCCATPARARCTCASARRRRRSPATTASTRRRAAELIASSHTLDEIARYVTGDSLGYLSLDGMMNGRGVGRPAAAGQGAPRRLLLRRLLHRQLSHGIPPGTIASLKRVVN